MTMKFYKFMLILAIVAANISVNNGLISCRKSVIFTKYGFRSMSAEDTTKLTTEAGSATQCAQFCLRHVQCQSIVYQNVTRLCELLSSIEQHEHKNTETDHVQYKISYQPSDCSDLLKTGVGFHSGIYIVYRKGENNSRPVYCDMETDGGGWTVIQRRNDIIIDFNQPWEEYKNGFGNLCGDMWIGNQFIHEVTTSGEFKLRLDLEGIDGNAYHVTHNSFKILDESQGYQLNLGAILDGNTGDVISSSVNMRFSTKDKDNDHSLRSSCADEYRSGWWYSSCFSCLPNGRFDVDLNCLINGKVLKMKMAEMKIKNYG